MPPTERTKVMTVRLSEDEEAFRDAIAEHLGTDGSSVMRQAMLKLGRDLGFEFPLKKNREKRKP
jgi:hypothetical protein